MVHLGYNQETDTLALLPIHHRYRPNGTMAFYATYPHDVGTSHIIEWYLHRALRDNRPASIDLWSNHPHRYADGEEEREGLWR